MALNLSYSECAMPEQVLSTAASDPESTPEMQKQGEKDECLQSLATQQTSVMQNQSQPIVQIPEMVSRTIADSELSSRTVNHASSSRVPGACPAKPARPEVTPSWFAGYLNPLPDPREDPAVLCLDPKQRASKIRKYRQAMNKQWGVFHEQEKWLLKQTRDQNPARLSPRTRQSLEEDNLRVQKERLRRFREASIIPPAHPDRVKYLYKATDQYPAKQEQDQWWSEQKKDLDEFVPSPRTKYFAHLDKKVVAEECEKRRLGKLSSQSQPSQSPPPSSASDSNSAQESSIPSSPSSASGSDAACSRPKDAKGRKAVLLALIKESDPPDLSSRLSRLGLDQSTLAAQAMESKDKVGVRAIPKEELLSGNASPRPCITVGDKNDNDEYEFNTRRATRRQSVSAALPRPESKKLTCEKEGWTYRDIRDMIDGLE